LHAGVLTPVHVPTPQQEAFRGIQKTVAYTVVAETTDLSRFAHPSRFMAWLDLVPGEHSSGTTRRQGPITRCGNRWALTLLIEAAWAYRYVPKVSAIIECRAQDINPRIRELAWKAQLRLTHTFRKLKARGMRRPPGLSSGTV
jgi:transposase